MSESISSNDPRVLNSSQLTIAPGATEAPGRAVPAKTPETSTGFQMANPPPQGLLGDGQPSQTSPVAALQSTGPKPRPSCPDVSGTYAVYDENGVRQSPDFVLQAEKDASGNIIRYRGVNGGEADQVVLDGKTRRLSDDPRCPAEILITSSCQIGGFKTEMVSFSMPMSYAWRTEQGEILQDSDKKAVQTSYLYPETDSSGRPVPPSARKETIAIEVVDPNTLKMVTTAAFESDSGSNPIMVQRHELTLRKQ